MRKTILITSTLAQPFSLFYRVPTGPNGLTNPVNEVTMLPRELLKEVTFPDEAHYNAFVNQNQSYIDSQKIIIGKTKDSTAEKINKTNSEKEQKLIDAKKAKAVHNLEAAGTQGKSSLKVQVSKESE